jgi:aminoglycoside phosphotransferase (APT) family kinase protein
VRQPAEDRALYFRQLRRTIATVLAPELSSATAKDAAGLVDRMLAEFVVEEEWAAALSQEYGAEFETILGESGGAVVTSERFVELRRQAADVVAAKAGSADDAERAQSRALLDVERRYLERVDALRQLVLTERDAPDDSALPTECSVTPDELAAYLRRRLPGSPDLAVTRLEVVPGGRSKETLLVSLSGTAELPTEVIVRKDRPIGLLLTKASDEFAIVKAVHDHGGVPVARPFFADDAKNLDPTADHDTDAGTLLVMERVRGEKAGEYFPDLAMPPEEYRHAIGTQLATALAHLHAVPLDTLVGTGLDLDTAVTEATVSGAVNGMAIRIGELSGPPIAAVPAARQWLLAHVDDVVPPGPLSLLQGDFGLHNTLVDGELVTALVDWEAATIGPPARELAAAWPAATALMEWPAFIATYCAAGGPSEATDERAVTYYRVFFALGACMTSRTGGHLFRTGDKRDLLTAHSGLDSHFRAQRNLVRALADAEALTGGG